MDLIIDPEFESLCPPLTEEEFRHLRADIARFGCLQQLIVWNGVLVDGHNRHRICTELRTGFKTREIAFMDRAHARDWIITQQLGRRNLTAEQKKYLIGLRFNSEKAQGKRTDLTSGQSDQKLTAEKLAEEYKIGEKTVRRSGEFAAAVDTIAANVGPQARTAILQRDSGMTAKNVVELARRPVEAQRAALQEPKAITPTPEPLSHDEVRQKQKAAIVAAWNKAGQDAREEFLADIDLPAFGLMRRA